MSVTLDDSDYNQNSVAYAYVLLEYLKKNAKDHDKTRLILNGLQESNKYYQEAINNHLFPDSVKVSNSNAELEALKKMADSKSKATPDHKENIQRLQNEIFNLKRYAFFKAAESTWGIGGTSSNKTLFEMASAFKKAPEHRTKYEQQQYTDVIVGLQLINKAMADPEFEKIILDWGKSQPKKEMEKGYFPSASKDNLVLTTIKDLSQELETTQNNLTAIFLNSSNEAESQKLSEISDQINKIQKELIKQPQGLKNLLTAIQNLNHLASNIKFLSGLSADNKDSCLKVINDLKGWLDKEDHQVGDPQFKAAIIEASGNMKKILNPTKPSPHKS